MCDFSQYGGPSEEWLKVEATLPSPNPDQSLEDLIRTTNASRDATSKAEMTTLSSLVAIQNHKIPTRDHSHIAARSYHPPTPSSSAALPIYITFHGGGFLFGTIDSEDAFCARIIATGPPCIVLNVNYRHTPTHTYPTAWNDADDAFDWVFTHAASLGGDPDRILVGGSSAGAMLACSLALRRQHDPSNGPGIMGLVLLIPWLVREECYGEVLGKLIDPGVSSWKENEFAPVLPRTRVRLFNELLKLPEETSGNGRDRRLNPGLAGKEEVKELPPVVFAVAGLDPLRDEALLFAKMCAENGVPTDVYLFKGVPHGFRRFGNRLSASKRWDEVVMNGICWVLEGPVATNEFEIKVR